MAYPLTSLETLTFNRRFQREWLWLQEISYTFFFNLIIRFYTVLSSGIPKKIELNILFKNNISTFVVEIFDGLLDKFKLLFPNNPKFIENLSDFLNIREFQQYLSSNTTDFSEDTFKIIKQQMIEKLEGMRPPTNDSQVNRYTNDSQVNRYTN